MGTYGLVLHLFAASSDPLSVSVVPGRESVWGRSDSEKGTKTPRQRRAWHLGGTNKGGDQWQEVGSKTRVDRDLVILGLFSESDRAWQDCQQSRILGRGL